MSHEEYAQLARTRKGESFAICILKRELRAVLRSIEYYQTAIIDESMQAIYISRRDELLWSIEALRST
jgi:hypothetical protein